MQRKRERKHALGLGHAMEDRGCPVGPTGMKSGGEEKYGCPTKYGVWSMGPAGVMFLAWVPYLAIGA